MKKSNILLGCAILAIFALTLSSVIWGSTYVSTKEYATNWDRTSKYLDSNTYNMLVTRLDEEFDEVTVELKKTGLTDIRYNTLTYNPQSMISWVESEQYGIKKSKDNNYFKSFYIKDRTLYISVETDSFIVGGRIVIYSPSLKRITADKVGIILRMENNLADLDLQTKDFAFVSLDGPVNHIHCSAEDSKIKIQSPICESIHLALKKTETELYVADCANFHINGDKESRVVINEPYLNNGFVTPHYGLISYEKNEGILTLKNSQIDTLIGPSDRLVLNMPLASTEKLFETLKRSERAKR